MRTIKVWYDDGDHTVTSINGSDEEIAQYYIGTDFVKQDETTKRKAVLVEFLDDKTQVGIFAKSIESGWTGLVVAVEDHGEVMLRMVHFWQLGQTIKGGTAYEWLENDDVQWFAPSDVKFIKPGFFKALRQVQETSCVEC